MEASQLELADSGWRFPEGLPGSVAAGHVWLESLSSQAPDDNLFRYIHIHIR